MSYTYNTHGTCSRQITFDLDEEGKVHNVKFLGGCNGNLQGIAALVEGQPAEDVIQKLRGINCNGKGTSCPDQLAKAIDEILQNPAKGASICSD